jgi:hypothetical protein
MYDIPIALAEAAALLLIGYATRRRAALILGALCIGAVAALRNFPGLMTDVLVLAPDAAGIVAGTIVGWVAIRACEARRDEDSTTYQGLAGIAQQGHADSGRGRRIAAVLGLASVVAGGGMLYVERDRMPAWRAALDRLIASPATDGGVSTAVRAALPTSAKDAAAPGKAAAGNAVTGKAVTGKAAADRAAADKARPPGAGPADGRGGAAIAGRGSGADRAALPGGGQADRSRGDLRHCLALPTQAEILRCAGR